MSLDAFSIDQFRVLVAVVEEGSFSSAARRLGRAQSAVTYAVQKLEEQSGVVLFDRSNYRPALTQAGRALLPRARRILDDIGEYRLQAQVIAQGQEAEIALVMDMMAPMEPLVSVLKAFQAAFPLVQLRISVEALAACAQALSNGRATIGLIGRLGDVEHLERDLWVGADLVAVAAPSHPLARLTPPLQPEDLRDHIQLVLTGRSPLPDDRDYGVLSLNQWRVTDLETKQALILAGLGWGSMPRHRVAADLAAGALVELKPARWAGADRLPYMEFVVAWKRDRPLGQASKWLIARLKEEAA